LEAALGNGLSIDGQTPSTTVTLKEQTSFRNPNSHRPLPSTTDERRFWIPISKRHYTNRACGASQNSLSFASRCLPSTTYIPRSVVSRFCRTNIKPSKDSYSKKGRLEKPANTSFRRRADESSSDRGMASILTGPSPAAPSPTVNYHKPSVTSTHGFTPQAKDRPGFFRRVFGSSKSDLDAE
jgi:hypothetical protein